MEYVSITTTTEAARMTVKELGELGIFHVVDLADSEIISKPHQAHKKAVVDCGTWERKLDTFTEQMKKYGVTVCPPEDARDMPGVVDVLTGVADYLKPIEDSYMANVNFMRVHAHMHTCARACMYTHAHIVYVPQSNTRVTHE